MNYHGDFSKMRVTGETPVRYYLSLSDGEVDLNELIDHKIKIKFTGIIHCVDCGKVTKKAFGQGFCYPCFIKSPLNSECIVRPELCEAHLGKGRDPEWEKEHHFQPHIVYLALTSGVKVGVTREEQVPDRWIDQGAWKAIMIAKTPYRQPAGQIEVLLKDHFTDKTSWQKMLKNEMAIDIDLQKEKSRAQELITNELKEFITGGTQTVHEFTYPVKKYPVKIQSMSPEKNPVIESVLTGIRGQYLFFDNQYVINIRNNSGYEIEFSA
jgi:hypothetical protein